MLIADAQVHIWGANTPERPWPPGRNPPHRSEPFSKEELLREMNVAGVQRAVLVPASVEGDRNDLVLEATQLYPDRFVVMGRLDIESPSARRQIPSWCQQPGMQGLRITFTNQGNPTDDWLWSEAEAAQVPIMMSIPTAQLHVIGDAAVRHPELKLAIDHLGIPPHTKDETAFAHMDQLLALARFPNIVVKVSALPCYTSDSYPYRRLHTHIRAVYDAFGPKRMFWGSDLVRLPCTYRQAITMFTEEIPWLTVEDKEWIMGRGLCEWIGWTLP